LKALGRVLLLLMVIALFVMGLNVTAGGLSALTLKKHGPVLSFSLKPDGDVLVTWLGTSYPVDTDYLKRSVAQARELLTRTAEKAQKNLLP